MFKKSVNPLALTQEVEEKVKIFLDDLCKGKNHNEILFISDILDREINLSIVKYIDHRDLYL